MSTTTTYAVSGMTCDHCVHAVTDELSHLQGVRETTIDLVAGGTSPVQVRSDAPLDEAQVRAAVDEAGYTLAEVKP